MSDEDFIQELGLPAGYNIDTVEQRFVDHVKKKIHAMSETFDEAEVKQEEAWMRRFHAMFFQCAVHWASAEAQKKKEIQDHPDAAKLKISGREAVEALQLLIIEFSSCYMHLNRFITLLREEIQKEEARLGGVQGNAIRWTADAGILMDRNKKQKLKSLADMQRMRDAKPVLKTIDGLMKHLADDLSSFCGKGKSGEMMRGMTAALRTSDRKKAERVLKTAAGTKKKFGVDQKKAADLQKKIDKTGKELIALALDNVALIVGHDRKLCLSPQEADVAYNSSVQDLRKVRDFMTKYYIPYLRYKLDSIHMLRDKLLVVGSLESLMTLYKRLITGIVMPIPDVREVRVFEGEVLNHTTWLLQGQFLEIPKIMDWAREIVAEFREGVREFATIESMEMDEVTATDTEAS